MNVDSPQVNKLWSQPIPGFVEGRLASGEHRMEVMANALTVLTTIALGLSAGALVIEGAVLIPSWRSLQPDRFLAWYREHARLLFKFFGPLEIIAAGLAVATLALSWVSRAAATQLLILSALLAVAVLAAFPVYFQKANASFAAGAIVPDRVPGELRRYSRWHWARTVLAVGAFVSAVISLLSVGSTPAG